MLYFTTNADGGGTEGIGALAQYQIICYALSKLYNVKHYFQGFTNLTHYQYFDTTPSEWDDSITRFFNLPISPKLDIPSINFSQLQHPLELLIENSTDLIINFEAHELLSFLDQNVDDPLLIQILQQVGEGVVLHEGSKYFDYEKHNIAIHIRRYTKTDCDLNPRREYFDNTNGERYINFIEQISCKNTDFHIYSQGDEADFQFLKKDNVYLHIEENPLISLYHMINADVLYTANSSLSYVAHLLGKHKQCYVRDTFFHNWKSDSIKI